jgi:hypothetical protein
LVKIICETAPDIFERVLEGGKLIWHHSPMNAQSVRAFCDFSHRDTHRFGSELSEPLNFLMRTGEVKRELLSFEVGRLKCPSRLIAKYLEGSSAGQPSSGSFASLHGPTRPRSQSEPPPHAGLTTYPKILCPWLFTKKPPSDRAEFSA